MLVSQMIKLYCHKIILIEWKRTYDECQELIERMRVNVARNAPFYGVAKHFAVTVRFTATRQI